MNLLPAQSDNIIDSLGHYINGTSTQVNYLLETNRNISEKLSSQVENIGTSAVFPIVDGLQKKYKIKESYNQFREEVTEKITQLVKEKIGDLTVINSKIKTLHINSNSLKNEFNILKNDLTLGVNSLGKNCNLDSNCQDLKNSLKFINYTDGLGLGTDASDEGNFVLIDRQLDEISLQILNHNQIFSEFSRFENKPDLIRESVDQNLKNLANLTMKEITNIENILSNKIENIDIDLFTEFSIGVYA